MATPSCGDEITEDTTLDDDLTCDSGPGLIITADNVTLDLGGHTVSGNSDAAAEGVGIVLRDVSGCTVRNGTVEHFGAGIAISGGSGNTVEHVTVQDNIGSADGDFGDGIVVSKSKEYRIRHNTVQRNGPFSGIGLVEEAQGNEVRANVVADNNMMHTGDPAAGREASGIRLEGPAANENKVVRNRVTGSGRHGIIVHPTCVEMGNCAGTPANEQNEISRNTSSNNGTSGRGDGIRLFTVANPVPPTKNTVTHNHVHHNATNGIGFDARTSENHAAHNTGHNNGEYDGFDGNLEPPCDANTWDSNDFGLVNQPCVRKPVATAPSGLQAATSALAGEA